MAALHKRKQAAKESGWRKWRKKTGVA